MSADSSASPPATPPAPRNSLVDRFLMAVERIGNRLPDPVLLFVIALLLTWAASWWLAPIDFVEIDPRTKEPLRVHDQTTLGAQVSFMTQMVKNFTDFPPLGLVLVALLGVAVAEHAGLISAGVRAMLAVTPPRLLTPALMFVAILSHAAGDTGFVVVIPLGGALFAAAGRPPLAGLACAFAGVSAGFSANFIPSSLDTLLGGITQDAARITTDGRIVNPLCNWYFMAASSVLLLGLGWFVTEKVVEPRLVREGRIENGEEAGLAPLAPAEWRALAGAGLTLLASFALLAWLCYPADSPFRNLHGSLTGSKAPLMESIVPLLVIFFGAPGLTYGIMVGTIRSDRDVVAGMAKGMGTMSYYLVLAFFAAQFTAAFRISNVGALLSIKGASWLASLDMAKEVLLVGVVGMTSLLDLLIGSASAKWAVMAPVLVPMFEKLGISPEWTQAAFRVGASCANVVTPLMPYFPLAVAYCRKYDGRVGVGSLVAMMAPYSAIFLFFWTLLLLAFWRFGLPIGIM